MLTSICTNAISNYLCGAKTGCLIYYQAEIIPAEPGPGNAG